MASIVTFTCCSKWNHLNGPDLVKIYNKGESEAQKKSVESADRAIVQTHRYQPKLTDRVNVASAGAPELACSSESRCTLTLSPSSSLIFYRF